MAKLLVQKLGQGTSQPALSRMGTVPRIVRIRPSYWPWHVYLCLILVHRNWVNSDPMPQTNPSTASTSSRHHADFTSSQHRVMERETRVRPTEASNGILVPRRGVRAAIDSSSQRPGTTSGRHVAHIDVLLTDGWPPVVGEREKRVVKAVLPQFGPEFVPTWHLGCVKTPFHTKLPPHTATHPTATQPTQTDSTLSPDATIRESPLTAERATASSSEHPTASCF
jgi:hypothetical protein